MSKVSDAGLCGIWPADWHLSVRPGTSIAEASEGGGGGG